MANDLIQRINSLGTPQFKYRFGVELPAIDGFDVKLIQDRIISIAPVLEIVNAVQNAPSANSHWYFFNDDDVSSFTITSTEWQDFLCIRYFLAWNSLQVNDDGTYNVPDYWKKTINVNFLSPDDKPLFTIQLIDAFPIRKTIPDLSYDSSDPVNIEVEFAYDSFKIK